MRTYHMHVAHVGVSRCMNPAHSSHNKNCLRPDESDWAGEGQVSTRSPSRSNVTYDLRALLPAICGDAGKCVSYGEAAKTRTCMCHAVFGVREAGYSSALVLILLLQAS